MSHTFLDPLPLAPCHVQTSADVVTFVYFLGTPLPHPLWTSYMEAPFRQRYFLHHPSIDAVCSCLLTLPTFPVCHRHRRRRPLANTMRGGIRVTHQTIVCQEGCENKFFGCCADNLAEYFFIQVMKYFNLSFCPFLLTEPEVVILIQVSIFCFQKLL